MANTRLSLVSRATSGVGSYIARTTTESGPTSGGLCLVAVIPGAEIAGMADWEYMNLVAVGASDFSTVRGRLEFENDGVGNCRIQFSAPDDAEGQAGPYLAKSAYSGIATVIVVGNVSPDGANGHFVAAYDWNGGTPTLITGSDASGGYGFTTGAHGGYIGLNVLPFASSLDLQKFGEFKVHSGYIATVADRCKTPEASDAGILHGYTAEEGSGDVLGDIIGSADMDLDGTDPTNRVWESGGIWAAAGGSEIDVDAPSEIYGHVEVTPVGLVMGPIPVSVNTEVYGYIEDAPEGALGGGLTVDTASDIYGHIDQDTLVVWNLPLPNEVYGHTEVAPSGLVMGIVPKVVPSEIYGYIESGPTALLSGNLIVNSIPDVYGHVDAPAVAALGGLIDVTILSETYGYLEAPVDFSLSGAFLRSAPNEIYGYGEKTPQFVYSGASGGGFGNVATDKLMRLLRGRDA